MIIGSSMGSNYMNLSNSEKGELIFKEIKNSYVHFACLLVHQKSYQG